MSHYIGNDTKYFLPASRDSIPEAYCSNKNPKPIPSSVQCVNVPSLTGNANASGTTIIQIPCGSSAGIMCNPYLRFTLTTTNTANAGGRQYFKGSVGACTAIFNRISTYVNSTQIDNIQNADQVYDMLLAHSSSADWLAHDATLELGAGVGYDVSAGGDTAKTFTVPLIGLFGSSQAFPLYLVNGTVQVQLDYNSIVRSFYITATANAAAPTAMVVSNVQLVYDRIQPEQAFIDSVRQSMMSAGSKFVYGYTNYQNSTLNTSAGQQTLNYGINVSSLRALVSNQILTADLSSAISQGLSVVNGLSQYIVSLDGRLVNNNVLDAANAPAVVFAELNKCFGRLFDATISDSTLVTSTGTNEFATKNFAVGVSAQRTNENLAFSGSPVSIVGLQVTTTAANYTLYNTFISDYQLLISVEGSCEIVR